MLLKAGFSLLLALPLVQAGTLTNFTLSFPDSIETFTFSGLVHTATQIAQPSDPYRSRFHANLVGVTAMGAEGEMYIATGALDTDIAEFFDGGFVAFGYFRLVPAGPVHVPPNPVVPMPLKFTVFLEDSVVTGIDISAPTEGGLGLAMARPVRSRAILRNAVAVWGRPRGLREALAL